MRKLLHNGVVFTLHFVHVGIANLWITPLERLIAPRLERRKHSRFYKFLWRSALWLANVGRLAIYLRLGVKRWIGPNWSVIYIGQGRSAEALKYYLFQSPPSEEELPRVFIWQVLGLVRKFTREGNLVVCEINTIIELSKKEFDVFFATPQWVKQILEGIDRPINEILADMNQNARRNIRRLETQDFSYEFTKDPDAFDPFYHQMYLPYIKSRHAERSDIQNYDDLYTLFKEGGLILVKKDQTSVCGMICLLRGELCEAGHMGVLDGQFDKVKQGSNYALWWFMMDWARQHGAVRYNFGESHPLMRDGVFNFKRQWGTRVYDSSVPNTKWKFYGLNLPPELRQYINQLGLISIVDGKGYRVVLSDPALELGREDLIIQLNEADSYGLAGLMLVMPTSDKKPNIIPVARSN